MIYRDHASAAYETSTCRAVMVIGYMRMHAGDCVALGTLSEKECGSGCSFFLETVTLIESRTFHG